MIAYSREHDIWMKKRAKELALRIKNNHMNVESNQRRKNEFIPDKVPKSATENNDLRVNQKQLFRDKVYDLFNKDQKLTNQFISMYETFYADDKEMYLYFNITYPELSTAFKGFYAKPDTVLKKHENLLNKFQADSEGVIDDDQTIFTSNTNGTKAFDFLQTYTPKSFDNASATPSSSRRSVTFNNPGVDEQSLLGNIPNIMEIYTILNGLSERVTESVSDDVAKFVTEYNTGNMLHETDSNDLYMKLLSLNEPAMWKTEEDMADMDNYSLEEYGDKFDVIGEIEEFMMEYDMPDSVPDMGSSGDSSGDSGGDSGGDSSDSNSGNTSPKSEPDPKDSFTGAQMVHQARADGMQAVLIPDINPIPDYNADVKGYNKKLDLIMKQIPLQESQSLLDAYSVIKQNPNEMLQLEHLTGIPKSNHGQLKKAYVIGMLRPGLFNQLSE